MLPFSETKRRKQTKQIGVSLLAEHYGLVRNVDHQAKAVISLIVGVELKNREEPPSFVFYLFYSCRPRRRFGRFPFVRTGRPDRSVCKRNIPI